MTTYYSAKHAAVMFRVTGPATDRPGKHEELCYHCRRRALYQASSGMVFCEFHAATHLGDKEL